MPSDRDPRGSLSLVLNSVRDGGDPEELAADGDPKTLGEIYAYGFRNAHRLSWDLEDGALFAMCLMFACRSMGWGACPLNLAIDHKTETAIRRAGGIPAGERLIMMIAFGEPLAPETRVAFSPRRPAAEIATLHA